MKPDCCHTIRFWMAGAMLLVGVPFTAFAREPNYEAVFGKKRTPEVRRTVQDQTYEDFFGMKKGAERAWNLRTRPNVFASFLS